MATPVYVADPRSPSHRSPPCSPQQMPRAIAHQGTEQALGQHLDQKNSDTRPQLGRSETRSAFPQKSQGRPGQYFDAVSKLGEGAFGVAHLCRDKRSGQLRVLKTINKRQSQVPPGQLEKEIRNLKACDHPHIIRLFEYYEDYENIYLIMEHAEGGELHQVLEAQKSRNMNLPERWVATVIKQCLFAISHVHAQGIIHKDLKAENILLLKVNDVNDPVIQPHAVIIDLGIAELFAARLGRRARCTVVAGTPTHMAPEVWRGNFGPVADVWSLGVVMFELLSGDIPFQCSSLNSAQEWLRMHRQGPSWSALDHCSRQARAICQRMLSCDERMRPTAQQCLGHSWFKEENGTAEAGEAEEEAPMERLSSLATLAPPAPPSAAPSEAMVDGIGEALADYVGRSKFEKAVMLQVASQVHTGQMSRIAEVFALSDTTRDGHVSREELAGALLSLGVEHANVESYVSCLDTDGNGRTEYTELVTGCIGLLYESLRGLLWQSFCVLDVDGNGVLGPEEVQAVVTRAELIPHGFPGNEPIHAVREVIGRMDVVDGNGSISFDELCRHFLQRPDVPGQAQDPSASGNQVGGGGSRALQDEEFAQLLDEIEADHGRASPLHGLQHALTAPAGALHEPLHMSEAHSEDIFHLPPRDEDASPLGLYAAAGLTGELAAMGVADAAGSTFCGHDNMSLAPQLVSLQAHNTEVAQHASHLQPAMTNCMSVEEELSQLLADVANGP